jgi:alpha-L-rhamnosidase
VFFRTAAYNGDVEDFYWKWLQDARDSQNEEGGYPDVIPYTRVIRYGNGAWADGCILIPYRLYLQYGSRDILEVSVESMERYMDFLSRYGLEGPNMEFGDWLAYEPTDKRYVSMAWYAYDAMTMETIEKILGRQEKALEYRSLYEQIREAFLSRYGKEEGLLSEQSQTAYLLALMARLLPESREEEAVSLLEKKIRNNGHLLSTGFVGTGILMNILGRYGRHHMAYDLLMQRNNPSWLYSVDQGATTIWERWNSYGRSFGFGDVSMNSFNHYAYGCVGEWMYRYMAGIDTSEIHPGFEEVILQPKPDLRVSVPEGGEQITWVKASYESRLGRIQVQWQWEREERRFSCQVSLAEGMRGIFCLPEIDGIRRVRLNGEELSWESGRTVRLSGGEWKIVME